MLRAFLIILVLVGSFAFAQEDRAVALLEGARLTFAPQEVQTLEVKLDKNFYFGGEVEKSKAFYFLDLDKERFYGEQDNADVGLIKIRLTPRDASVTVNDQTLPKDIADFIVTTTRTLIPEVVAATQLIPMEYQILSYDGVQSYGDLVRGEQVTLRYDAPGLGETVGKLLFGQRGELLGGVIDVPILGESLILYDVFGYSGYLRLKTTTYTLNGSAFRLLEERRYDYLYNRPIDPSYFELP